MRPSDNIEKLFTQTNIETNSEVDKVVLDDAVNAMSGSRQKLPGANKPDVWRIIMNNKMTKLAAVAAVIIVAGFIRISEFGGSIVWADVVKQIRMVETMSYEWTHTEVMNPGSESEQAEKPERGRAYSQDPGKFRWESLDENGEIRQIVISLASGDKRRTMAYNLARQGKWDTFTTSGIAVNKDELYRTEFVWKTLESATSEQAIRIGEKVIDGKSAVGFRTTPRNKNFGLLTLFNSTLEVWVDQATAIPIYIEVQFQYDDSHQEDVFDRLVMKNIHWNVPMDQKRFQLPEGEDTSVREDKPLFFSRTQLKDNVTVWVGPRGGEPVVTEKDIAKVSCGVTSIERIDGREIHKTVIYFDLNKDGEEKMRSHTRTHTNEKLLIDFNGEISYEPTIKTEIGPRFIIVICDSEVFAEHELAMKEFEDNYLKE